MPRLGINLVVVVLCAGSIHAQARPGDSLLSNGSRAGHGVQSTVGPSGHDSAAEVLDAALAIVKRHALRRDHVDWSTVEPRIRASAAGAEISAKVYPAIRQLLLELGDRHSFLSPPSQATAMSTGAIQNSEPDVRMAGGGVGYVKVPGYLGWEPSAARGYAERFHEALNAVRDSARCGWIVDLRQNTGGNMWPMLAGLKPFLGDAALGTFEGPSGTSPPWRAGNGIDVKSPPSLRALESAWVAVLIGPRTTSSGEAVTIAFRGRSRTRSFGLPTAGLSTSNRMFPLPDGAAIVLTTAVDVDRAGRRYGGTIEPDEYVDNDPVRGADTAVEAATLWLRERSTCTVDR